MNPFLLTDFYKLTHLLQYRPELRELTSYLTPRGSRLKGVNKVVFFGLSAYVHSYIVENFRDNFFRRNFEYCECEIREVLELGLGYTDEMIDKTIEHFKALHELQYLPVEINAVPEGTLVPMGVPCVEIKSTNPEFFWVGQALEASLSAAIWHPMVSATIAREYRKIARGAFSATVENGIDERTAMCDFSMRGQESNESAVNASVAWLTSMWNSSTVAARKHIKDVYGIEKSPVSPVTKQWKTQFTYGVRDKMKDTIVRGLTSTEHSVMTSHACLDDGYDDNDNYFSHNKYVRVDLRWTREGYDVDGIKTLADRMKIVGSAYSIAEEDNNTYNTKKGDVLIAQLPYDYISPIINSNGDFVFIDEKLKVQFKLRKSTTTSDYDAFRGACGGAY